MPEPNVGDEVLIRDTYPGQVIAKEPLGEDEYKIRLRRNDSVTTCTAHESEIKIIKARVEATVTDLVREAKKDLGIPEEREMTKEEKEKVKVMISDPIFVERVTRRLNGV